MIKIARPAAPPFLNDSAEKWHAETEAAKTHYLNGATDPFKFEVYNDKRLKAELAKVFVKCAYCESSYAAVYDGDVEHFRPKGKIKEKTPPTPGYYWLANDWDNLFLACQHCNQRRKHILFGEEELASYGKLDQFPLNPEDKRLTGPDSAFEEEEKARLLINPCLDKPEEHLAYEPEQAVIVPLTPKGTVSVNVYVLQRPLLVQERKKRLLDLFTQLSRVKQELEDWNESPGNRRRKERFEFEMKALNSFTGQEKPYAGMCRYFVKKFLKENGLI
jgi:hypothetical protein